mgnify:CR=1 FL=1
MSQKKKSMPGAVLLLAALGFVLGHREFVIVGILPEHAYDSATYGSNPTRARAGTPWSSGTGASR